MASKTAAEQRRLNEGQFQDVPWKKWGPYVSERQWGTVREDYSTNGNAWDYFSHDQARSRAYRWGEDGIAGICDDQGTLCFALALWNGRDPIIKERLFGLTNSEGNHGEDVKEYYFYLDSTPTHSYMKYLYKYPQAAFPYSDLVLTNRKRGKLELEYELIDTGVFDDNRYFDVFVEYAKASPEQILIQITAFNRGPENTSLHLLPTLWFRNNWSWNRQPPPKPQLARLDAQTLAVTHSLLGSRHLHCDREVEWLVTDNETNRRRVYNLPNSGKYVKDGINDFLVEGRRDAINPAGIGTKAAAHYQIEVPAGGSHQIRLLLAEARISPLTETFGEEFDRVMKARLAEADEFYNSIIPSAVTDDARNIARQAYAGMLWSKQFYYYPVDAWINVEVLPPDTKRRPRTRNLEWFHLESSDIISMPDKWEYPWFAAWDLAFHCFTLAGVDIDFAKNQMQLITNQVYLHPNGQIPAYEWNFSDVNPPVHCKAVWQIYEIEKRVRGKGDRQFLEGLFHKLLMNFTWWVNRKDALGDNVFEGGFLGLDNIGVFDRSAPLPTGGTLEQADGTSWMAMFCLDMMTIALELALENPVYEELGSKFFEHFIYIVAAMDRIGVNDDELWDEEDGFFYDVLRLPDGKASRLKVRSMVGLIPLFATAVYSPGVLDQLPKFRQRVRSFAQDNSLLMGQINDPRAPGVGGRRMLSAINGPKLRRILSRMLDESEFLSDYGIRALSRVHKDHPYVYVANGQTFRVDYEPAESSTGLFGGNSNWRGPIWMPVNALIIQSLRRMYSYFGDDFKVECPTGSGRMMTLWEVSDEIGRRLTRIFLRNEKGERPVFGDARKFQDDPNWRDLILFYEYFHGDIGAGIGASHQTGWTGVIAPLIRSMALMDPKAILEKGFETVALPPQIEGRPE